MMINVYTANTPNGIKIPIALEELGVPYKMTKIDLAAKEQKQDEFLNINPNGRIPAIVDDASASGESLSVFESGAILMYLAEKYQQLIPADLNGRTRTLEWLFFQVSAIGPMFGQYGWFNNAAQEKNPLALNRFQGEANRLTSVIETQLSKAAWLNGVDYSIADIANFGWLRNAGYGGVDINHYPATQDWVARIAARPATQRGLEACQFFKYV